MMAFLILTHKKKSKGKSLGGRNTRLSFRPDLAGIPRIKVRIFKSEVGYYRAF